MSIEIWIPAGVLAIVLWLGRNLIATRLTNAVRHEFELKLADQNAALRRTDEELKAELRTQEEELKADLRQKEAAIAALRAAPLSGMAARMAVTDKRRVEAVDQLWEAMHDLGWAKVAASFMAVIKFEAAAKAAAENKDFRQMFTWVHMPEDMGKGGYEKSHKARPHVSPLSWAYFSAYQAIVLHAAVQLKMLAAGLDMPSVIDHTGVVKLITTALPHQQPYIEQYGVGAAYHLLEELEGNLLNELRETLSGKAFDLETLKHANAIQREATSLASAVDKAERESSQ